MRYLPRFSVALCPQALQRSDSSGYGGKDRLLFFSSYIPVSHGAFNALLGEMSHLTVFVMAV